MSLKPLARPQFRPALTPSIVNEARKPVFVWVPLAELVVDSRYQREMGARGLSNVRQIVEHFDWSKFGVLTCVRVAMGERGLSRIAIVDGQHRATAALLHPAIEAVPCWITQASLEEQARACVAINSAVTRMTSMQMFHAAVASGDGLHVKAAAACQAAGVTVLRYPLQADKMKLGETLAVGALVHCARRFPQAVLTLALTALKTQDEALDVPGHVNATTIKALCALIDRLDWQHKSEAILATLSAQPIAELWDEASMDARTHGGGEAARLTAILAELDEFKCLFARAAKRGTGSY